MSRRLRPWIAAIYLTGILGVAATIIWWAESHRTATLFSVGVLLVTAGVVLTILRFAASDDFMRRHFGEAGAVEMRRAGRRGWIGILLGGALLGLLYLDHCVEAVIHETQLSVSLERGRSAAKSSDWPAAVDAYSEAIRLDPTHVKAYANRGVAFIRLGDLDHAIVDLSTAIDLNPSDARNFYNRGIVYFRMGKFDQSVADLSDAIRLDPKFARAFLARSMGYHAMRDDAKAWADRNKAIELDPSLEKVKDMNIASRTIRRWMA